MFNGLAAAERAQFVPLPLLVHLKAGEWGGGTSAVFQEERLGLLKIFLYR